MRKTSIPFYFTLSTSFSKFFYSLRFLFSISIPS